MSEATMDGRHISCSQCQKQMRPVWTLKEMHCPSCQNLIKLTRNSSSSSSSRTSSNRYSVPGSGMTSATKLHPGKRAVLCGVSYKKRKYELKGTVNDVKHMKELLLRTFGFLEENILVLTEEEKDEHRRPTRKNILDAFQWLIRDCRPGYSLVFFFSGHGLRHPESDGDELDGFDESICPVDFTTEGTILDNDINSAIVRPLPKGVTLHALVDSCHSGTVLDLPYVYDIKKGRWLDNRPPSGAYKGTNGGLAICLSACADEELAADTSALHGKMSGAMTSSFIQAVWEKPGITYKQLLKAMQDVVDAANKSNCLNSRILSRFFHAKMSQEPVLSCSEMIAIEDMKFEL
ncbi:metacaspase-1-like isoform X2 [Rhodamnia argentea]|uniref:Metacaspase-1-like isoform X2 n=1 Tax=Rhodamnia argentea TaxID=178133 RepID=A0A8B8PWH3_9MYRT|nr:metacaspase-1-like isoform X2 [Rhodamnia argentea]